MNVYDKKFIYLIRSIGYLILFLLSVDIIFFKHQYITQTFIGNGLFAGTAAIMTQYKIDYSKKNLKERLLGILNTILFSLILFYFWFK